MRGSFGASSHFLVLVRAHNKRLLEGAEARLLRVEINSFLCFWIRESHLGASVPDCQPCPSRRAHTMQSPHSSSASHGCVALASGRHFLGSDCNEKHGQALRHHNRRIHLRWRSPTTEFDFAMQSFSSTRHCRCDVQCFVYHSLLLPHTCISRQDISDRGWESVLNSKLRGLAFHGKGTSRVIFDDSFTA